MTNLLATILITVVTNSWHPKMPVSENYYFLSPTNYVFTANDRTYTLPVWQEQDDPDTLRTEVREIESLSFAYKGKDYRVETGNRLLSSVTKRRKVKQTEEWVEESSMSNSTWFFSGPIVTNGWSVTNITDYCTVATNTIIYPECQKKLTNDLPDSPSALPLVVLKGDVDTVPEDGK